MQINWFTVVAQIINFLILVYLLKRFLYRPVIKAMNERAERIEGREREAKETIRVADDRAKEYLEKTNRLEQEKEGIIFALRLQAEEEKKEYLEQARVEIDVQKTRWEEAVSTDQARYMTELKERVGLQSCRIAQHLMADVANQKLESGILDAFIEKLSSLEEKEIRKLRGSQGRSSGKVMVCSSFDLDQEDQYRIQQIIEKQFDRIGSVEFCLDPELICGIQLEADGYQLEWSIGGYLRSLEADFLSALAPQ